MRAPLVAVVFLLLAGCSTPTEPEEIQPDVPAFELSTPAWIWGEPIPDRHTCDGDGDIPSLFWNGAPHETTHYALLVKDLDADAIHWAWWNLPSNQGSLFIEPTHLPRGTTYLDGLDFAPPCPPEGELHRYLFKMVALAKPLTLEDGVDGSLVEAEMDAQAIGLALLRGTYERGE